MIEGIYVDDEQKEEKGDWELGGMSKKKTSVAEEKKSALSSKSDGESGERAAKKKSPKHKSPSSATASHDKEASLPTLPVVAVASTANRRKTFSSKANAYLKNVVRRMEMGVYEPELNVPSVDPRVEQALKTPYVDGADGANGMESDENDAKKDTKMSSKRDASDMEEEEEERKNALRANPYTRDSFEYGSIGSNKSTSSFTTKRRKKNLSYPVLPLKRSSTEKSSASTPTDNRAAKKQTPSPKVPQHIKSLRDAISKLSPAEFSLVVPGIEMIKEVYEEKAKSDALNYQRQLEALREENESLQLKWEQAMEDAVSANARADAAERRCRMKWDNTMALVVAAEERANEGGSDSSGEVEKLQYGGAAEGAAAFESQEAS